MDDLHRFRKHEPAARPTSLDGLLRTENRPVRPDGNPFVRHRTLPARRLRLDDFGRPAGFYPAGRSAARGIPTGFERRATGGQSASVDTHSPHRATVRPVRRQAAGRRMVTKALSVLVMFGLISAGYFFGQALLSAQQTFGGGAAAIEANIQRDGRINILLIGRGGEEQTAPDLTDTLILASLDPINNQAALVSIPRDLYVRPKPHGGYTKINAVYANAKNNAREEGADSERAQQIGLQAIQEMISEFTGVPVHYFVMVDFVGFKRAIDVVGGVSAPVPPELAVAETMRIDGQMYRLNVPAGQQQFDGFRALAFARSRLTSPNGDFTRSERQKLILLALGERVMSVGTFANPIRAAQLIDAFGDHVRTNLSGLGELTRLYDIGRAIDRGQAASISLVDPPNRLVETDNIGGLSVVVPVVGLGRYQEIHEFLGQRLRDGFLARENAQLVVLNGTARDGLAGRAASELRIAGYSVAEVADAPVRGRAETMVVRVSERDTAKTGQYLERFFNLRLARQLPDGVSTPAGADFVILLGADYENRPRPNR